MKQAPPPDSAAPIRVALVEDDPDFSDALRHAVTSAPGILLSGKAGTRADGLAMLRGQPADVLLVDLGLPDGSGIDVIRAAARHWPHCSIMVNTNFGDETHVMRSIESGAAGYLPKDGSPAKMADEIRSLAGGGSPISPIIAPGAAALPPQPASRHRRGARARADATRADWQAVASRGYSARRSWNTAMRGSARSNCSRH